MGRKPTDHQRHKGAALLLSLVILLVLTLLAVSGMQGSIMQERMATAQRDGVQALEIAEAALAEAESILDGLSDLSAFGSTNGFYDGTDPDVTVPSPFDSSTWSDSDNYVKGTKINGVEPAFIFEYKGKVTLDSEGDLPRKFGKDLPDNKAELEYARILVRVTGPSGLSARILEGFYVFQPGGLGGGNP